MNITAAATVSKLKLKPWIFGIENVVLAYAVGHSQQLKSNYDRLE